MALLNPSFEDPGAFPGEAEHWTLRTVASLEQIAGFGPLPERAWEDFERWLELWASLEDVPVARAFFAPDGQGIETFEQGFQNVPYFFELPTGQVAPALFGGDPVEDLEAGWSNVPYLWTWDEVPALAALFDGEPHENFDDHWHANESFYWTWADVAHEWAMFVEGTQPVEDMENDWPPASTI
jgi:hypothetical protein